MEFKNKNVLVVGLGKSGTSAIIALYEKGSVISALDDRCFDDFDDKIQKLLNEKAENIFLGGKDVEGLFDIVVVSPGVSPEKSFIVEQKSKGAIIMGELELAYQIAKGTFVGITGTNGKTTTTSLVGEIFEKSGRDTRIVGNIGNPVVIEALNDSEKTWYVTEVSSFQLETIIDFKPKVASILNLTPDHLDRHKTIEAYGAAKERIGENQQVSDYFILNLDDEKSIKLGNKVKSKKVYFTKDYEKFCDLGKGAIGAFLNNDKLYVMDQDEKELKVISKKEIPLPGSHNLENVLAAITICYFSGIDINAIRDGILGFGGVEHRVEIFAESNGIKFVNDSKGTNPDATIKAVEAMENNIILIAGGYDKNADYTELLEFAKGKIKSLILLGQTKEKIKNQAEKLDYKNIIICEDLDECVEKAFEVAKFGDKVVLSPACASWGMYPNYEIRGKHFKSLVKDRI